MTLKLRPRATSPHIRQFIDERDSWLLGLLLFSIFVLIVFLRQFNYKESKNIFLESINKIKNSLSKSRSLSKKKNELGERKINI